MPRVALIGGADIDPFVADLSSHTELDGSLELVVCDADPERLRIAALAASHIVERLGGGHEVGVCHERRDALVDADYVIADVDVSSEDAALHDLEIPRGYGLIQSGVDTIGIAGIMRGLRTLPTMIDLGGEMAELCPGALLLTRSRPSAMVPWAMWAASPWPAERTIGLSDEVRDTQMFLASLVGLPTEEIAFRTAGPTGQCFVYGFRDRETGDDLYPRMRKMVVANPDGVGRQLELEVFRRFGFFPATAPGAIADALPWFLRHPDQVKLFDIEPEEPKDLVDEAASRWVALGAQLDAGEAIDLSVDMDTPDDVAATFIVALETGGPNELSGSVRNGSLIEGMPEDACVEVPLIIDEVGVRPTPIGKVPPQCLALHRTFLNVVELTVRAVVEGSRDLVYQAALLDPNAAATLTVEQIVNMVDDLLEAHGSLIPRSIRRP